MSQTPKPPAVEPPDASQLEFERKAKLLQQVRVMRESQLARLGELQGCKPDTHYQWVNVHPSRVTFYQGRGYTICRDPDVQSLWRMADLTHVRGDSILMQCPKELKEAWDYEAEMRAIEDLENSSATFQNFAERNGVPVNKPAV